MPALVVARPSRVDKPGFEAEQFADVELVGHPVGIFHQFRLRGVAFLPLPAIIVSCDPRIFHHLLRDDRDGHWHVLECLRPALCGDDDLIIRCRAALVLGESGTGKPGRGQGRCAQRGGENLAVALHRSLSRGCINENIPEHCHSPSSPNFALAWRSCILPQWGAPPRPDTCGGLHRVVMLKLPRSVVRKPRSFLRAFIAPRRRAHAARQHESPAISLKLPCSPPVPWPRTYPMEPKHRRKLPFWPRSYA